MQKTRNGAELQEFTVGTKTLAMQISPIFPNKNAILKAIFCTGNLYNFLVFKNKSKMANFIKNRAVAA